jgi:hypothetical protein
MLEKSLSVDLRSSSELLITRTYMALMHLGTWEPLIVPQEKQLMLRAGSETKTETELRYSDSQTRVLF